MNIYRKVLIQNINTLNIFDYMELFADDPYMSLYVQMPEGDMGVISCKEYVSNLLSERQDIICNKQFTSCSDRREAEAVLRDKKNIHFVPVVNEQQILEEVVEEYQADVLSINGIKARFSLSYKEEEIGRLLKMQGINKVCIVLAKDILIDIVEQTANILERCNIDVQKVSISEFIELCKTDTNQGTLIIDFGTAFWTRTIRKGIWNNSACKNVEYMNGSSFLCMINNAPYIAGEEKINNYLKNVMEQFGEENVYIITKNRDFWLKKIGCNHVISLEKASYNIRNSNYEIHDIAVNAEEISILVNVDIVPEGNEPIFVNNKMVYSDYFLFNRELALQDFILNSMLPMFKQHGIELILMQATERIKILSKCGKKSIALLRGNDVSEFYKKSEELYEEFLGYDTETSHQLFLEITQKTQKGLMRQLVNEGTDYIISRPFLGNNQNKKNTIWLFGCCLATSPFTKDEDSFSAILGTRFKNYNVVCYSSISKDLLEAIRYQGTFAPGDIVIIMPVMIQEIIPELYEKDIKIMDFTDCFLKFSNIEQHVWQVLFHCNYKVIYEIGKKIIPLVESLTEKKEKFANDKKIEFRKLFYKNDFLDYRDENELGIFMEKLQIYHKDGNNGAIVMNCNPFTLGHQYIIEYAASQVDYLYIFVVQEDKSFFKFQDRFEMVKKGTEHLENVIVLPSGEYMISAITMPGYFEKDSLQNETLDASLDLKIFAEKIAKKLNISIRFVGTEPIDKYTNQYNEEMKRILVSYGINVVELERRTNQEGIISASKVRKLLKENNIQKLKEYVPETTFQVLLDKEYLIEG